MKIKYKNVVFYGLFFSLVIFIFPNLVFAQEFDYSRGNVDIFCTKENVLGIWDIIFEEESEGSRVLVKIYDESSCFFEIVKVRGNEYFSMGNLYMQNKGFYAEHAILKEGVAEKISNSLVEDEDGLASPIYLSENSFIKKNEDLTFEDRLKDFINVFGIKPENWLFNEDDGVYFSIIVYNNVLPGLATIYKDVYYSSISIDLESDSVENYINKNFKNIEQSNLGDINVNYFKKNIEADTIFIGDKDYSTSFKSNSMDNSIIEYFILTIVIVLVLIIIIFLVLWNNKKK